MQFSKKGQRDSSTLEGYVAAELSKLAAVHQEFLRTQSEVQRSFLASRQHIAALFGEAMRGESFVDAAAPAQMSQPVQKSGSVALSAPEPDSIAASLAALEAPRRAAAVSSSPGVVSAPSYARPTAPAAIQARAPREASAVSEPVAAVPTTRKPAAAGPAGKPALRGELSKHLSKHVIVPSSEKPRPVGPTFDEAQIAIHASGKISEIFGPEFACQDDWRVQVRMPEPPLLLCHRVTGIDCELGKVGTGSLWCESDIPEDAWYLHEGRMPVGIMIESGQADLMLISWMGADFENKGDRVYRLLGCELMFHGGLARPGDVLKYDIHIAGHARQDAIRLFFFHYDLEIDGQVRLSVRNGQAGFFSYAELAESNGILWTPADDDLDKMRQTPLAAPPCLTSKRAFSAEEVQAFSEGRAYQVFGEGFERAAAHTAPPRIQSDKMRFMDEVLEFDVAGGPWGRGYLKAVQHISPDDWFFDGHFLNDPCMPGTLMFEGCVQVMGFYMAACGWTIDRDGWVFEPVPFEAYPLRCRGQVSPTAREVIYEVFVREVHDGEQPRLYADLLCTVDGLKAFHCARMGLQLTPAWPMDRQPKLTRDYIEPKPVAKGLDGFAFGYDSLLACAWGKPTRAFGSMYAPFDSHRQVARLPGPPYHFISRVVEVDATAQNAMRGGVELVVEYDVAPDAWYFSENGAAVMPYAVLLEAALQPCGWLASYVGCALTREDIDLCFRNLDGTSTQQLEVTPQTGTLRTRAKLLNIARAAGNIIVSFEVQMWAAEQGDTPVFKMDTVFGFFPPESLANQVGLPEVAALKAMYEAPQQLVSDLAARPARSTSGSARLAEPMLLMLDRVTGWWPEAGEAKLGQARAVKDVNPDEWFFKAHFFQDPVQPGSLGLEALLQLLQWVMLERGMDEGLVAPRFEAIALNEPMTWKYRGQVVPRNKTITSTLEVTEVGRDEGGVYALAEGSLWVDGMRIYHAKRIGMRLVSDDELQPGDQVESSGLGAADTEFEPAPFEAAGVMERAITLAVGEDAWLRDHCPTYTHPALPMMSIVDLLMEQAQRALPGQVVLGLEDVELKRWVAFLGDEARVLRTRAERAAGGAWSVVLESYWEAPGGVLSRYDEVARARVVLSQGRMVPDAPFAPLEGAEVVADGYASGELFHGPAFQVMGRVKRSAVGGSSVLDVSRCGVPRGVVHPGLLDGALQCIPHASMERWWPEHDGEAIAYPHAVRWVRFFGPTPQGGALRVEARFVGGEGRHVTTDLQIFVDKTNHLWCSLRLVEVLLPKGRLGHLSGGERRAFLRDRVYVEGASLSVSSEGVGRELDVERVLESNWFKGTLEAVYGARGNSDELTAQIVAKECVAELARVHPGDVELVADLSAGHVRGLGLMRYGLEVRQEGSVWRARSEGVALDVAGVAQWWRARLGVPEGWLGDDVYGGLLERFVERVWCEDAAALGALRGKSALFLANHEVQIESLLITILASALTDTTVVTMANAKHEAGWVGQLIRDLFGYPGCEDPRNIVYFNQADPASMLGLIAGFKRDVSERVASVMVHAPGTRAQQAGAVVERVSSALLDMALELEVAIVPVHFSGGLPQEALAQGKLEFPVEQTGQVYAFGRPILASELRAAPYAERRRMVLDGINRLAPDAAYTGLPRLDLSQEVSLLQHSLGLDEVNATLLNVLMRRGEPGEDALQVLGEVEGREGAIRGRDASHEAWLRRMVARFTGA